MKLIIKLYNQEGEVTELKVGEEGYSIVPHWHVMKLLKENGEEISKCVTSGGRIEIAQDV